MSAAPAKIPLPQHPPAPRDWPSHAEIPERQPRNLLLLALHQIVFRVGWVFKTESVIMPAFLDTLTPAGSAWRGLLRGFMPVINRAGQSVPPVLCAPTLRSMRVKKRALAGITVIAALPFLALSGVWVAVAGRPPVWMPVLFLALYGAFFSLVGLYQMAFGTVQGKLIQPDRRGRLLLISTALGAVPSMLFALWLMPGWLELHAEGSAAGFASVFGFTGVCFLLSGLLVLTLAEPAGPAPAISTFVRGKFSEIGSVVRHDANMRRLILVAMLFATGLIIFPHYQALAREQLDSGAWDLVVWVVVQNGAVGAYSLFVGPLADRRGYRLTLRTLVFASAVAPMFAVGVSQLSGGLGKGLYWLVFIPLGVSPLALRTFINYALEIAPSDEHPRYLSALTLFGALPFVLAPGVGLLVDVIGFRPVFLTTAGLLVLAGLMTFRLEEPRHRVTLAEVSPDEAPPILEE